MVFITNREYGRKGIDKLEWRLVWIGVVGKIGILVGGSVDRMQQTSDRGRQADEWQGRGANSRANNRQEQAG